MVNCTKCNEKITFLEKKLNHKEKVYCESCHEQLLKEDNKEHLKKVMKINPKWEYCTKKVLTVYGDAIKIDKEVQKLGEEGWELVHVATMTNPNFITGQMINALMFFKRKIAE